MNIPLLKRVKAAILKHPKQFEMADWFSSVLYFGDDGQGGLKKREAGGCGTAACIAGWVCHIDLESKTLAETDDALGIWASDRATTLLDIPWTKAGRLFHLDYWPSKFQLRVANAKTLKARARAAADRINWFIKTKGKE